MVWWVVLILIVGIVVLLVGIAAFVQSKRRQGGVIASKPDPTTRT